MDSAQYFVQCRDNYLRMGRRNLDGYRLYQDAINGGTRTDDLFDAASVCGFPGDRPILRCTICSKCADLVELLRKSIV